MSEGNPAWPLSGVPHEVRAKQLQFVRRYNGTEVTAPERITVLASLQVAASGAAAKLLPTAPLREPRQHAEEPARHFGALSG